MKKKLDFQKYHSFLEYNRMRIEKFKTESDPNLGRTISMCRSVQLRESLFAIVGILESVRIDKLLFEHDTKKRLAFIQEMTDVVRKIDETTKHKQKFVERILDELYLKCQGVTGLKLHWVTKHLFMIIKSYVEISCMTPSGKALKLALEVQRTFETLMKRVILEEGEVIEGAAGAASIPLRFKEYLSEGLIK